MKKIIGFKKYVLENEIVPKDRLDFALSFFSIKSYSKKEEFHFQKGPTQHIAYIESGSAMYYNFVNGEKQVIDLLFDGDWMGIFNTTKPYDVKIQFIEDTKVWLTTEEKLNELSLEIPNVAFFRIKVMQHYLALMTQRLLDQTSLNAKDRLIKLLLEQPHLFQRIPQYYIAAFLGVKPQSFSRLRKNLKN